MIQMRKPMRGIVKSANIAIAALMLISWRCSGGDDAVVVLNNPTPFDQDRVAHRTILPQAIVSGKAMSGFVGYVLVIPKTDDNPHCTLTSAAIAHATLSIVRYVPADGVLTVPLGEILYQSVVDKSTAASIGYLAGALSLSDSNVAEVIIEDAVDQEVEPSKIDLAGLTQLEQRRDPNQVCAYYYISRAFLTTVKSKTYSKIGGNVQAAFAVNVNGSHYVSTSGFTSKAELAIDARPLSTLVQPVVVNTALGKDTVSKPLSPEIATAVLTSKTLPDTASAKLPAVIHLPSTWYDKQRVRINRISR
jgi:hypothetical protein